MDLAVRCRDLRKTYDPRKKKPVDALNGLNLDVGVGECFGLLGPNGAGKTTTVEILEGLLAATSGEVEVLGRSWNSRDQNDIRQRIGITLQETRFNDKLTVLETLQLFRSFYRVGREPQEVLSMVALDEKTGAWVGKLSGGQRQRLAVACALVGDPELLFLDEPTTGLDPQARRELWDIIREQRSRSKTTIITTHYMDEAQRLCDRVAVIDHGNVIALGSPEELILKIGGEHIIEFNLDRSNHHQPDVPAEFFTSLPSINAARRDGDGYSLTVAEPHVALPALISKLQQNQMEMARITTRHVSLEDVFVTLTGRHFRNEELSST